MQLIPYDKHNDEPKERQLLRWARDTLLADNGSREVLEELHLSEWFEHVEDVLNKK